MLSKITIIISKRGVLRNSISLILIASAALASTFARAETVQDQCTDLMNLTEVEKAELGIMGVEWKTSDSVINTPHCKILMVAGPGEFSSTGLLIDPNQNFPSAGIMRVSQCYNETRALFYRPGGSFDLTESLDYAANFLRPPECMAVMNIWWPTFQTTSESFLEEFFSPPNNFRDQQKALSRMMHLGRDVLKQFFGGQPQFSYYLGISRGALWGTVNAESHDLAWIDGWVIQAGGDGPSRELIRRIWACQQDLLNPPISELTNVTYSGACTAKVLANEIGILDPRYREEIMNIHDIEGEEAALEHALAYDIAERPPNIQNDAEFTNPKGDLLAKTIVIHGLRDDTVSVDDTLRYYSKIIAMEKQDLVRTYLSAGLPHALPTIINITFVRRMIRWVEQGEVPHDVTFNIPPFPTFTVKNCTDRDFGNDPCGCFDDVNLSEGCHDILGLPPME